MDSTKQTEVGTDLKSLLLYPVYNWKKLLLSALAIAVLCSAFIGIKEYKRAEAQELYADEAMEEYLHKKQALETRLDLLEKDIENQHDYLAESVLLQIDPFEAWCARYRFYVDTDYKIMPAMAEQEPNQAPAIAAAVSDSLESRESKMRIAQAMDLDVRYADELYRVSAESGNVVSVEVIADTEEKALAVMDLVKEELKTHEADIRSRFGNFETIPTLDACNVEVNTELLAYKNNMDHALTENRNSVIRLQDELSLLSRPGGAEHRVERKIVMILVAAPILCYVFYCFRFLIGDRLHNSGTLNEYWHVNTLGVLPPDRKYCRLVRWVRKLEHRADLHNTGAYALTALNIRKNCGEKTELLVTGGATEAVCRSVTEKLQEKLPELKLQYCGSFLTSEEGAEALETCEGVILIEQCDVSENSRISQEIQQLHDLEKTLIGCIVIDL